MARKKKEEKVLELPQVSSQQLQKGIGDFVTSAYLDFGDYINNHRHMPEVVDGLKISYRRLIYSATQFPKGKEIPSTTLQNYVANYHPHGLTSMNEMSAELYHAGIFSGEGSFGFTSIDGTFNPPAAPRYTHTWLSNLYWDIIGDLIKEVPYVESPLGALEPQYLPLPIPACLYIGVTQGLGVGISTLIPNFSPKSLYEAYINNNPELLEPNVDLFIDKKNSQLNSIWTTGKGKVIYCYKISRSTLNNTEGILFEGDTSIFTPKLAKFKSLIEEGKVYTEDLTDQDGPKLFIGRVPGARGCSIDDIENLARKACYSDATYVLNVTNGKSAFRIPLYDWLDYTYKNYINLVTQVNQKKIEKCKFDIKVQECIPLVGNLINQNPKITDAEICETLNIDEDIVAQIMSKPISYLRNNKDTSDRVKSLKDKLKELKAFDAVKFTEDLINKL
jgi:hypothetical protein